MPFGTGSGLPDVVAKDFIVRTSLLSASGVGLWLLLAGPVWSQTTAVGPPAQNVVQLTASGVVDVQQDLLVIRLSTSRDGPDAATVQAQLKTALDASLTEAKKSAQPGQMEVHTGQFSLHPRYGKEGKINGWQGTAELVLEGRDFARIGSSAARIQGLSVAGMSFALSREQRQKAETEAQAMAIDRFKARASELAKSFGFTGYTLREVAVQANDQGPQPRPVRMLAMEAKSFVSETPIPLEAGKTSITMQVSGSVQLK